MKWLALYLLARFALTGVVYGGLWLIGFEPFLAALTAVALSVPLAYFLLRDLRDRATTAVQARATRRAEHRRRLRDS